ncbi:MAG: FAD-dependent oxidoreductase [Curvibacter sp.]|nr:FAD-dependent oxidoreductase [Curvibacter sp.]
MATRPRNARNPRLKPAPSPRPVLRIAVVGAGMAGIACARTLAQAGHQVEVFEAGEVVGGRMATVDSPFGGFDSGAQYFTVRDPRFEQVLALSPRVVRPWSANAVRVLDEQGQVSSPSLPHPEPHWVATPGMDSLLRTWAQPLQDQKRLHLRTRVVGLERDTLSSTQWQLRTEAVESAAQVHAGFDRVVLALPAPQAQALLGQAPGAQALGEALEPVSLAPCWTLMLAFPQAVQPGLTTLGPQWNAARSTHHRIAWLARESSKPGRRQVERWTVQASDTWSTEHLQDSPERVQAKLLRAFADVTGIHATPAHLAVQLWPAAKTLRPLGQTHLWDHLHGLGVCGDWCLGHRVEDAFVSGLSLALALA